MNLRFPRVLVVAIALTLAFSLSLVAAPPSEDRFTIQFRDHSAGRAAVVAAGGRVVHDFPEYSAVAAWLPAAAVQALQRNPNVVAVEVDPKRYPMAQTVPYGITMVQADLLSDANAAKCRVCIIDSGFAAWHEDLQDSGVTASADSRTGDPFTDRCGHGTHVAGTVAALANDTGVVGVAPKGLLNLHIVKVFGDNCAWAYSSDLVAAARKCRDARKTGEQMVISMSLGGSFKNGLEDRAFKDLYSRGFLSIAAAGNAGTTATSYPAGYASVVSVAAVDSNKVVAGFSQKNSDVEIAAPGVAVMSTVPWLETNSLTVDASSYQANHVGNSGRTEGETGTLANGGRCTSAGSWAGQVVLCERGDISFRDKVNNVQAGGGVSAVIYNNVSGNFLGTCDDGTGTTCSLPGVSISQEDGQTLITTGKVGSSSTVLSKVDPTRSGYEAWDGTSMATPHVSAVAALVWSYNTGWSNAQIRDAMNRTAQDLGTAGRDTSYGYGLVQAKKALNYLCGNCVP